MAGAQSLRFVILVLKTAKIEPSQKDSVFPYVEGALSLKKDTDIRRICYGMKQAGVLGKVGGNMSKRPRLTMKEEDRG